MSLRVWLPLNGNLDNQGLSDVTVTGGKIFTATGKLSSTAYNDTQVINIPIASLSGSRIWSFCFWGYVVSSAITTNWTKIASIIDGNSDLRIEVCPQGNYSNDIYCYSIHNNGGYVITSGAMASPNGSQYYNNWTHFCITSDGTTITKYLNGVFIGTIPYDGDGVITGTFTLNNSDKIYKQDVRIYDHCLSAKEVKEISKGLCLHYKLDGVCNTIDSTEWDCSGFSNNGTNSDITIESISSRYSSSYNYSTNNSTTNVAPCFSNGQIQNELTTSIWFKTDTLNSTNPNLVSLGENSFWRFRLVSATSIWAYIRVGSTQVATTLTVPSSIASSLIDNKWHLCAVSFKDGVITIYIDGISIGTYNASSTAKYVTCGASGSTWHLAGYTSTSESFIGNLSDFRIYATALSDADILELYNTPINIDNKGNLYAYEFIEEDKNNFSKQGIAKNSEFIDLDTAGDSYTHASISSTVDYANIFIEK